MSLVGNGQGLSELMDQPISREGKYLTFNLAKEEYGLGILKVREIMGLMPIRPVPRTPPFVKGVINLRGQVIPVINLRYKFGMREVETTNRTSIIVVEVKATTGPVLFGLIVDEVSEVINVKNEDVENTPRFGTSVKTEFILGMAKTGRGVKILLDIDRVLAEEELLAIQGMN